MSIKRNFAYSSILTVSNYLFPLVTFPYVSRVLGVTNIGICNYVDSIISYFCVFSAMGVAVVGVREVANVSDNYTKRSNTFLSIFTINVGFTIVSIIALLLCNNLIPDLIQYRKLLYIGCFKLVSNLFLCEWFYKGIEDFEYITKRALIIKILYVLSIFIFVRQEDDYVIYFTLTILHIGFNALVNLYHHHKRVSFSNVDLTFSPYIKPYIVMGVYTILTTMYTTFNVVILGYISGPTEVGYFTTSTKILGIVMALFTAFTGVMLPRMSSLLSNHEDSKFMSLLDKSMNALLIFAVPTVIFFCIFSPDVINLIGGKGYEGAIVPFRIIMPTVLIIGYEQILIIQALMPMKKDCAIFINSCIGATIGLIFNFLLVPSYGSIGSAVAYALCEFSVLCSAYFFIVRYTQHHFSFKELLRHLCYNIPILLICFAIYLVDSMNSYLRLILAAIIVSIYVYVNNYYLMKNQLFIQFIQNTKNIIWK